VYVRRLFEEFQMNPMEAVAHQQLENSSRLNSRGELTVKPSRKLLLAVALTSTVGWIYFLSEAAWFVGATLFF
jgi:hypothetical protein